MEFSCPETVPELSRQAAELVLEIGNYKRTRGIDKILENMVDRTTVVAIDGSEQVIGTAGLRIVRAHIGMLEDVVSEPRRRRSGVGSSVVQAVENIARWQGISELVLASTREGVPFYKHLGYTQLAVRIFQKYL